MPSRRACSGDGAAVEGQKNRRLRHKSQFVSTKRSLRFQSIFFLFFSSSSSSPISFCTRSSSGSARPARNDLVEAQRIKKEAVGCNIRCAPVLLGLAPPPPPPPPLCLPPLPLPGRPAFPPDGRDGLLRLAIPTRARDEVARREEDGG